MKYSIDGLSDNEIIKCYFVRENDILVRYLNGRTEVFPKNYKDILDKMMLSQVLEFINTRKAVRSLFREEIGIYAALGIYYEVFIEILIRSIIKTETMNVSTVCVLLFMWFLSPHLVDYVNFELEVNPRLTKEKLDELKKYVLYIKHIDVLKDREIEDGKVIDINTIQNFTLKRVRKIVREVKRNDRR